MKDSTGPILFTGITLIAIALFWGARLFIKGAFQTPPQIQSAEKQKLIEKQSRRAEDIRQRQRLLMESQRERMRDMQR